MKSLLTVLLGLFLAGARIANAGEVESPPDSGTYAIREVPAMTALVGSLPSDVKYFDAGYADFSPLLDYLDKHDVDALAPIEGLPESGRLFFPLRVDDSARELPADPRVAKVVFPKRLFATHVFRGGYDKATLDRAEARLRAWLADNPRYRVSGSFSYAYWSPYYYPAFVKKAEVRIPVVPVENPAQSPNPTQHLLP